MRKSEDAEFLRLILWIIAVIALIGVIAWGQDWWIQKGSVRYSEWRSTSDAPRGSETTSDERGTASAPTPM